MKEQYIMPQEIIDEVLAPGYGPVETGYRCRSDGSAVISILSRLPNCTSEMMKWWMGDFMLGTKEYQFWHQDHTTLKWDDSKKPGTVIGATHYSGEYFGDEFVKMRISFWDPEDICPEEKRKQLGITDIIKASVILPDDTLMVSILQVTRDYYRGTEMRQRAYLANIPPEACQDQMLHCLEEMENLAEFLPGLYAREMKRRDSNPRL